jgi:aminocarboxymuconate-semialdehyde decarboxylase
MLLPRLEQACRVFPALAEAVASSPTEQARRLFYDTLVFDDATLAHLVATFGAGQLMIGTDYRFAFRDKRPVARILVSIQDPAVRGQRTGGTAARFLGRPLIHLH